MKKKLLSIMLALVLSLSLCTTALAAEEVTTVEADNVRFANGAVLVQKNGKYGVYTYDGKKLIDPTYNYVKNYSDGMAATTMEGAWDDSDSDYREWESGVYGYIDTNGKLAIPMKYVLAYDFSEDRAFVREEEGGPLLMINKSGSPVASYNNVVVGEYDDIRFHEGLAVLPMKLGGGDEFDVPDFFVAVDTSGKIAYTFTDKYVDYINGYHDGLIAVAEDCIWGYNRTRIGDTLIGAGYRDKSGNLVIQCEYDDIHPFHDGVAAVGKYDPTFKVGFINTSGNLVVPVEYAGWWDFNNGIGAICKSDEKGALIDKNGKILTDFIYTGIWPTSEEGFTPVQTSDGLIRVLDKAGKTAFTTKDCTSSSNFAGSIIGMSNQDKTKGYIFDQQGHDITPTDFDAPWYYISQDYLWLKKGNTYMVYRIADLLASASSKPAPESEPTPAPTTPPTFTDVAPSDYFAAPVAWAVEKEITTGTGNNKFSPDQDCTNAQILTFIWRAYGKPEPTIDNPFTNSIPDGYKKAAVWAHEKGMVSGTIFDTDRPCTRAMAMTYLWQAAGSPKAAAASFTDVSADATYASAVAWAVEQKITTGTSATSFSPDDVCNRGQIVTFLHRAFASAIPKASEDLSAVDFSAEYMSSPYYDALQKVVLTGNYRQDILAVASSQIGYSEGDTKDQLSGSYHGSGDYTEYGRYLDSNGSAWCSEFASWCARVAKVPTNILHNSKSANVEKFAAPYYTWSQSVYAGGTYTPQPGDLALFAWHGTSLTENHLSHTAIVYEVKTRGNIVEITVIHGNSNNSVAMSTYTANASSGEVSKGYLVYFVAPEYDA